MTRSTALYQVLGAITYGEQKAHDGAKAEALATDDPIARRELQTIAAEELRHYKGFRRRLEALGADPDRAMQPYMKALDTYHGAEDDLDEVTATMWSYLGEGVADDLLTWLRGVTDEDTASFIDTVIADEERHEARATEHLRTLLEASPENRAVAGRAARQMIGHMIASGAGGSTPTSRAFVTEGLRDLRRFGAFLQLGKPAALLGAIVGGYTRRMHALGLSASGVPLPRVLHPLVGAA